MSGDEKDIISQETQQKQKNIKQKSVDDLVVSLVLKVFQLDQEKFKNTEQLIVHIVDEIFGNMPFKLQRRITKEVKEKTTPNWGED